MLQAVEGQGAAGGLALDTTTAGNVLFVVGLATAGIAFVLLVWGINAVLSPRNPTPEKVEPYECGLPPAGEPWAMVSIHYATVALLFVLFDAEAALLFAVVSKLRDSVTGLLEAAVFTAFLAFGLAYAWRKGALQWRS